MASPRDWNKDYGTCCEIIDRLEDFQAEDVIANILRCVCANYPEASAYVVNYHSDILEEE